MADYHVFNNTIADGTNTNVVRPRDWNSAHLNVLTLTGNTAGVSTVSGTNIVLAGGPNVTLSASQGANAATLSFSAAPGGGGNTGIISAGTTNASLGTVQFFNSNGISFGLNGQTLTASHNALTTARASTDAVGLNTALTAGPLAWTVNSSGISLNAASAAGTTSGFAGGSISGSMTHNTAGLNLSLAHPAWLTTAMQSNAATISNIRISAGTTSNLLSALTFANSNGITFGLNASTLTASHNGLTTARASNDGIGLNTAQSNVTWTVNSAGLSLDARGYAGTNTTFNGVNVSGSMTVNSAGVNLSLSAAAAGGGGTTNQTGPNIGVSNLGNTAGSTGTVSSGNVVLAGFGGISLSQSTGAGGSNATISISAAPQATISHYYPPWGFSGHASNSSLGQSTVYFMPFDVPAHLSASRLNMFVSISGSMSAGNSTGTCSAGIGYAIYSMMTGADSRSLSRLTSYSMQLYSLSMTSNTAFRATHYAGLLNQTSHSVVETAISNANASTYLASNLNGPRVIAMPVGITMTPGRYYLGVSVQTVSGNAMTNNLSVQITSVGVQPAVYPLGQASAATNASVFGPAPGWGFYSAQTSGFPDAIPITTDNIRRQAAAQTLVQFNIVGYSTSTNVI